MSKGILIRRDKYGNVSVIDQKSGVSLTSFISTIEIVLEPMQDPRVRMSVLMPELDLEVDPENITITDALRMARL